MGCFPSPPLISRIQIHLQAFCDRHQPESVQIIPLKKKKQMLILEKTFNFLKVLRMQEKWTQKRTVTCTVTVQSVNSVFLTNFPD